MSRAVAPKGTMRAACDVLLADLLAAVEKFQTAVNAYGSEETDVEELVASTPVQIRLAQATESLHAMTSSILMQTRVLRDKRGSPVTSDEIKGACECDDCKAKSGVRTLN